MVRLANSVAFEKGTNALLGNILGMDRATGEVRVERIEDGVERRYPASDVTACWLDNATRVYIEQLRASVEGGHS